MTWDQLPASYDAVAQAYEGAFLDELDGKAEDRALLQEFAEVATDPVGDLGCGPGQVGSFLRNHDRRVIGVDNSAEMHCALRSGGRVLLSAHEGLGVIEQEEFLGHAVPFVATLFGLDELVEVTRQAGLHVATARRREPLASEHPIGRLYVAAERPLPAG